MTDLVDRIARGEATLLGVEDICTRLGVSRSTFDRWVRNGGAGARGEAVLESVMSGASIRGINSLVDSAENARDGSLKFPPPDIRIGNSPKWEMATFKRWLTANISK